MTLLVFLGITERVNLTQSCESLYEGYPIIQRRLGLFIPNESTGIESQSPQEPIWYYPSLSGSDSCFVHAGMRMHLRLHSPPPKARNPGDPHENELGIPMRSIHTNSQPNLAKNYPNPILWRWGQECALNRKCQKSRTRW